MPGIQGAVNKTIGTIGSIVKDKKDNEGLSTSKKQAKKAQTRIKNFKANNSEQRSRMKAQIEKLRKARGGLNE